VRLSDQPATCANMSDIARQDSGWSQRSRNGQNREIAATVQTKRVRGD
jgi:hypothetical protein